MNLGYGGEASRRVDEGSWKILNRLWKEHLQALKFVQQAVGLRGYAQRDPLIEYKLERYNLFLDMMAQIRRNVIYSMYQVWRKLESKSYGSYVFFFSTIAVIYTIVHNLAVSTSDGKGPGEEVR